MSNAPNDDFRPDLDMHETLTPFDAMDQSGKRAMVLLGLTFGLLLFVALIIFKVYQPGVRDRDAPPTINAENTPFKYKPENPGGEVTPDQDKEIYKAMDGSTDLDNVQTTPLLEIPITIPKSANITVEPATSVPDPTELKPIAPKLVVRPKAQEVQRPSPVAGRSNSVVQVASVRTRADAEALWNGMNTKFKNLLSAPLFADIKRVDLGDKGIYYRLRVAGFSSKAEAKRLCDTLKGRQQACFVAKK